MGIASNGFERQGCRGRDARRIARAAALVPALLFALALPAQAQNPIVTENGLAGTPASTWDVSGSGDPTIQGFATDISVNKGETVRFKINTSASGYQIQIYRLGYYQGNGARRVGTGVITATLPQNQPSPLTDAATGLVDCGNWAESAHWDVPSTAVSGIYIAKLIRNDNSGASHIVFIVRDDSSNSDLLFKTSDTTWQAYNVYGGNSLYVGNTSYPGGHATMVSYNRPFVTRAGGGGSGEPAQDWLFNAEYPMVRFLEANGYNVTYTTNIDAARRGNLILNHKVFLSVGHDEYWSGPERASVEAARDAGVHMAFFSGNEIYWKTRWANSIDATNTPYRTLVCYKEGTLGENQCGGKCDPLPTVWTGLWRDGCGYTPANDGCRPENALSGQISWNGQTGNIVVPSTVKSLRFWRNTSVASLGNGASQTMTAGTLGYEWDPQQYDAFYPHGRILLSTTDFAGQTHHLSLYRAPSGALVFGAGTVQWSWGLDRNHDRGNAAPTTAMQQATVNLFADMGAQPGSIIAGLSPATQSSDVTPPTTTIVSPTNGASVTLGSAVTISGNASDVGGQLVGVEVSVDGGATWNAANGTTTWNYSWTPTTSGSVVIKSRGFDDSGRMSAPGTPPSANAITVNVGTGSLNCPCTAFLPTDAPAGAPVTDGQQLEVGVKFRPSVDGVITGVRFYKGSLNTGTHIGHLWSRTGTMLAEATFSNETASGWQEVTFPSPVSITANTTYIASYHSTSYYSATSTYFTTALVRGPLRLLADGEDGGNGIYDYGAIKFPVSSFQQSNYWVDLVFNTSSGPDVTPPTVLATSPTSGASGVPISTSVTATFNEPLNAGTITTATVVLRDPSLATVTATVSYDAASRTATLVPAAPLAYTTTYSMRLAGGSSTPRITDVAGNALAADATWSFTTSSPPPPPPNEGPGGPVLVLSAASNPFSRFPVEILRAEGFNLFAAKDVSIVTPDTLNAFDVVIVGDIPLTSAQVTNLTNWVNAGGTLIALRPSKLLASLLGLTDAGGTLSNTYLKVNNASGAGVGITGETIQFHGTADRYTLNGATAVATLYSNANSATSNPAVTTRTVGGNGGRAIAFTYDLARSVVYTRQGNPAWSGQERDGTAPIRSDDLFFGAKAGDVQPDWVDLNKVAIPQADEQQRLLANLILQGNLHRKPLPRFWYFPKGKKAVVIMTGDNHGDYSMAPRFDIYRQQSPANCSVDDWECVRATGYEYVGTTFTNSQAQFYNNLGFEVALHVNTNCSDWNPSSLENFFSTQMSDFAAAFPGIPAITTNRTHCIAWSDWSTQADIQVAHGIRFDTNYYYWPPTWVNDKPGVFTGSGMPMRFARTDGSIIDCYQATTQMTDESGQTYPMTSDSLLARALDVRGYYGAFCANMHFDNPNHPGSNAIVGSAQARGIPVVSSKQMLTWLDGRNGSAFRNVSWSGSTLGFTVSVATGARNMQAILPFLAASGQLMTLTRDGSPVAFTTEVIKGINYAQFPAAAGNYAAIYGTDTTAPVISAVSATATSSTTASVTWTTNELSNSRVDYGTSPTTLTLNATNGVLVTSHAITLTGLAPTTTYYYRVTSADGANNSSTSPNPPTAPRSFTTPATPPNTPPVAGAAGVPSSGNAPLTVNFSGAASTDANGDSLTYSWTFGDGGTATGRLTSHTYASAGAFGAILTVNDGRGGTDTASVAISVTNPPAGFPQTSVLDNFNRANGSVGSNWVDEPNAFTITSNVVGGQNGDHYIEWNGAVFGPDQECFVTISTASPSAVEQNLMLKTQGTSWSAGHLEISYSASTSRVTVYTFTPPGNWQTIGSINGVTFVAGDRFGARALANGSVQLYRNATLLGTVSVSGWSFAGAGGRIGLSVGNAPAARYDDFGGGNYSATPVNTPPVAAAAGVPQSGNAPLSVSFSGAASTDANGDSLTYAWTFGDGGTATGRLTSHTYAAGSFAAILTVNDGHGGTDTASVAISSLTPNVAPVAVAAGSPQSGTAPLTVNFSGAASTDSNGDSLTYAWTFGDGGTATGRLTSHIYGTAGSFAAILTVTDGRGGSDTASVAISTTPPPANVAPVAVATGTPRSGTAPLTVNFSGAESTDANGDSLTYAWTFGDGGTATGRLTSHTYAAGNFAAILTVNDGHGGTDTASVAISAAAPNVAPVAAAAGVPTSGNAPLAVNFSGAASTDANGDSLTYAWTFGDGGTATGRLTSHTYATAGAFGAILTVNDGRGGTDTASVAISVANPPNTFPQNAVLDNFNRANGAPGANWIDETAQFSITSNTLAGAAGDHYLEWATSFGADQEAYLTFGTIAASGVEQNLMLKTQGASWSAGHIEVSYNAPSARVFVYTFTPPGNWQTFGQINGITFVAGDRFGARAFANGTVTVYRNATLIGTVSVSGWSFAASGGRIGVSVGNASTARFDDFGGGSITGVTALSGMPSPVASRASTPDGLELAKPYPNPTTGAIQLALALPSEETVSFAVLDIQGREVWSAPSRAYAAGRWTLAWDGHTAQGPVNPGVYLLRVTIGHEVLLRRIAVIR
jgi:PKD repeat protein